MCSGKDKYTYAGTVMHLFTHKRNKEIKHKVYYN